MDVTIEFEQARDHLRGVAYRMLGSLSEADDAVQEAWLRLDRTDTSDVTNLRGWLTTVVARVCLDMLRTRKARREDLLPAPAVTQSAIATSPEQEAVLADSVGLALLVVLDTLTPAERLAFVLHDLFAVPFEDIAPVMGGQPRELRGARTWAQGAMRFARAAQGLQPAIIDGDVGLVFAPHGELARAFIVEIAGDTVVSAEVVGDPARLAELEIDVLPELGS